MNEIEQQVELNAEKVEAVWHQKHASLPPMTNSHEIWSRIACGSMENETIISPHDKSAIAKKAARLEREDLQRFFLA